jgi:hypothetical protein
LAGSGSTWFVEGHEPGADGVSEWLGDRDQRAWLVRAHTVPAGWDGAED